MEWRIVNRRATLFVEKPFNITEEVLPLYASEFAKMGLLPSVNKGVGVKITPTGLVTEDILSLDLKRLDETLKVNFGPDRVDFESSSPEETWPSFHDVVVKLEDILTKTLKHRIVRLALCGLVFYKMTDEQLAMAYEKLAKSDGERPVEWVFRKVLRSELESEDKKVRQVVNNVYALTSNTAALGMKEDKGVLLDMDVNTLHGASAENIATIQELFWRNAAQVIEEAVANYQKVFADGTED